jgi:malate dehydrogenase (oxaloacetate-decarboxylating)(NADP+)
VPRQDPINRGWTGSRQSGAARTVEAGSALPSTAEHSGDEIQTAAPVAKLAFDAGLARVERPDDMISFIPEHVYSPKYSDFEA